ncbi:glycerol-3-phosphate acyltransferase, partial [Klebsiella pneumoniae]|uniref:glycerol-3-phosphate acyltransferase n=2 Tax=Pseudomonadota TaxID=1224 RepID=UPI0019549636
MSPVVVTVIFSLAAYLIGSISFAVVVSRAMGLADPRTYGSGNPGATNVLRSGNKKAAILT